MPATLAPAAAPSAAPTHSQPDDALARVGAQDEGWRAYARRAGLDGDELERIADWDPWSLQKAQVADLAHQLVHSIGTEEYAYVDACLMVLLRSDLNPVVEEVYAQRLGGLCLYLAERCESSTSSAFTRKLAKAASIRIYVHLLLLVEAIAEMGV